MVFIAAAVIGGEASQEPVEVRIKEVAAIDPGQARQFFISLKAGIRTGNRRAVCDFIEYPSSVYGFIGKFAA